MEGRHLHLDGDVALKPLVERSIDLAHPAHAEQRDDSIRARAVLETILKRQPTSYNMWARAMVQMYLGDSDAFFTSIAYEPHHAFVPWVRVEPAMIRLKDDPRYPQLFARLKLPLPVR
jgi:hypothetical protein